VLAPCILPQGLTPHVLLSSSQNHSLRVGVLRLQRWVHPLAPALSEMRFCSCSPPPLLPVESSSLAGRDRGSNRPCAGACSRQAELWAGLQPERETAQKTELKRAQAAFFSLPYGACRELCVRVGHYTNRCKSHTKRSLSSAYVSRQPFFDFISVVKMMEWSSLIDSAL